MAGKTFLAFPAHAQPQFCVSGKRPIALIRCHLKWHVCYLLVLDLQLGTNNVRRINNQWSNMATRLRRHILWDQSHTIRWINLGVEWARLQNWMIRWNSLRTIPAVPTPGECQSLCLATSGCLSINYDQRGDMECSLNNCTRLDAGTGYIQSETSDYYEYYFTPLGKNFWFAFDLYFLAI